MNLATLRRRLAIYSHYSDGEIDQRTRWLNDFVGFPSGPRGRHAPDLGPYPAALACLCLVARRATDAEAVALRFKSLMPATPPDPQPKSLVGECLAQTLGLALDHPDPAYDRFEFLCEVDVAWLILDEGKRSHQVLFGAPNVLDAAAKDPRAYYQQGLSYTGHRLVLTSPVLRQLAEWLAEDAGGGEAG